MLLAGCGGARPQSTTAHSPRPSSGGAAGADSARCGNAKAYRTGQFLRRPDGARIWYRVEGPAGAPMLVYLHGGPGYNSYDFEQSAGPRLARQFRMVYVDQRGCGRSAGGPAQLPLGMEPTLADLEALREELGVARWTLIGHSFGGVVAVEYLRTHPERIASLVLVDTAADPPAALRHQVEHVASVAPERFPEHSEALGRIASTDRPALDRLVSMYERAGRVPLQAELHWASEAAHERARQWDARSGLRSCTRPGVLEGYRNAGYLTEPKPGLAAPLDRPAVLIAGRRSEAIGTHHIEAAAQSWEVPLRWLDAGHFVFVEKPRAFAQAVSSFMRSRGGVAGGP
jgi:proline iminopeptidase